MVNSNNLCYGCMNEKVMEGKCPICGYNPDEPVSDFFLKPGTVLDSRYLIGKVIESNGEGVTYIGYDTVTASTVNVREFLPLGLCERDADGATVLMLSGSEYSFNDALTKYIELSRELFKLNELPALFDVLDVRESNNTAYRITRAVPGISLREFLMRNGGLLKWDQARSLFAPLVASISAMHKAGVIHRGISPDTLIVGKDGKLRLSGFCIAECRTAKSALTSQLFPGFAAVEQYGAAGTQGPWTDIYAFAATIYRTLVGNPPPEATDRLENDNMTIPAKIARETPKAVLETLANALQVLPQDRTQNIDSMRHSLSVSSASVAATATVKAVKTPAPVIDDNDDDNYGEHRSQKPKKKSTGKVYGLVAGIVTAFFLGIVVLLVLWATGMGPFDNSSSASTVSNKNEFSSFNSNSELPASKNESTGVTHIVLENFEGKNYTQIANDSDYKDIYKFKIIRKEYNNDTKRGEIISQSPKAGEIVQEGTTIEVVVSLGPQDVRMTNVIGLDKDSAIFELLKAGYAYENIIIEERLDSAPAGTVIQTYPEQETICTLDDYIILTVSRHPASSGNSSSETGGGSSDNSATE